MVLRLMARTFSDDSSFSALVGAGAANLNASVRHGSPFETVPSVGTGRHTPLTEDVWFTRTIAEEEKAREIREKAKGLQFQEEGRGG